MKIQLLTTLCCLLLAACTTNRVKAPIILEIPTKACLNESFEPGIPPDVINIKAFDPLNELLKIKDEGPEMDLEYQANKQRGNENGKPDEANPNERTQGGPAL